MLTFELTKCITSTRDTLAFSYSVDMTPQMSPCTHEEADTRLIVQCPEMHVLASNMNRQPYGNCSPFLPLHVFLDISANFTCSDSARQGVDKIILCRVNIDVVVIAVSNFRNLGITGSKR